MCSLSSLQQLPEHDYNTFATKSDTSVLNTIWAALSSSKILKIK